MNYLGLVFWALFLCGIGQFMLKKGAFSGNSACEGMFDCIKNEMFCNGNWAGVGSLYSIMRRR